MTSTGSERGSVSREPNEQEAPQPWSWYWAVAWFIAFLGGHLLLSAAITSLAFLALEGEGGDTGPTRPAGTPVALGLLLSSGTIAPLVVSRTSSRTRSYLVVLGLRAVGPRGLAIPIVVGVIGYATILVLPGLGADGSAGPFLNALLLQDSGATLFLLSALLIASAFEELLFRGFLVGTLVQAGVPHGLIVAVSALAWCIVHPQDALAGYVAVVLFACLLAEMRLRTGSIAPCMLVHVLWNAAVLAQALWLA